ncbi:MAG: hypothetical protein Q8L81_07410 [Bacteroidota bacterium]|nr:hypothetical protein [Bacteroidota bacterium]
MKKQIILGSFLALAGMADAQTWAGSTSSTDNLIPSGNTYRAGRVGIGTTTPANKMEILTAGSDDGLRITQTTSGSAALLLNNTTSGGKQWTLNSLGAGNNHGVGNFSIYDGVNSRFFIKGADGNIGIGNTTPVAKLDVNGDLKLSAFSVGSSAIEMGVSGNPVGTTRYKVFGNGCTYIGNFSGITYNASASVLTLGQVTTTDKAISVINGTNPTAADVFAVYGDGKTVISSPGLAELRVTTPTTNASKVWVCNSLSSYNFGIDNAAVGHIACNINSPTPVNIMNFGLQGSAQPQVWIGNTKPQSPHTDFSFAVAGKMVAQSLYITAPGSPNWLPDYVFANDYKLQSLYEVEKYYKANKHLPDVPSAKEVDENGLDIAEMNIILLKKVEELTIHMVEQQRQIDELKNKGK